MSYPIPPLRRPAAASVLAGLACAGPALTTGEPLVGYSARKYPLVEQLFQECGRERIGLRQGTQPLVGFPRV